MSRSGGDPHFQKFLPQVNPELKPDPPVVLDPDTKEIFNPVNLVQSMCKSFWFCQSALTSFAATSLVAPKSCNMKGNPDGSLWPIPPPRWRWMDCKHLNPRRRQRLRFNRAKHDLLVLVICSLNFEVLGFPTRAPPNARLGAYISSQQHAVIERLDSMLSHFMQMPPWVADDLGRAREKFEMLINQIQELPKCTLGLEDLTEFLSHLHGSFDSYSEHFARSSPEPNSSDQHQCTAAGQTLATDTSFASARPVISDRIKWENPPSFAAREYLDDPLLKAAFDDPEVLRKPP